MENSKGPLSCSQLVSSCNSMDAVKRACPRTCGLVCPSRPQPLPAESRAATIMRVAVESQGFVARAFSRLSSREVDAKVTRWFGRNDDEMRRQVRKNLLGSSLLLNNAYFKFPGVQCSGRTIAYVAADPPSDKNSRGMFNIHICEYYLEVADATKIQTITHESFHHHWMRRHDMCSKGDGSWGPTCPSATEKAYGKAACRQFAAFPDAALENADTFAYFILGVNNPYTGGCEDQSIAHLGLSIGGRTIECYEAEQFCTQSDSTGDNIRKHCGETCGLTCQKQPTQTIPVVPMHQWPTQHGRLPTQPVPWYVPNGNVLFPGVRHGTTQTVVPVRKPPVGKTCFDQPSAGFASQIAGDLAGGLRYPSCGESKPRCHDSSDPFAEIIRKNCPSACGLC